MISNLYLVNFILSVHDNIVCISKIHILLICLTYLIENWRGKTNATPRFAGNKKGDWLMNYYTCGSRQTEYVPMRNSR